ncbi:MAG: 1,6-anhydro-N-acetylmuramyl-L-alanine amidase AmpD, partial [Proteobacteria bacterium]
PDGAAPEVVIVHAVSLPPRQYGGRYVEDLFTNRLDPAAHPYLREIAGLRVSAHFLVRRDGSLAQFVPVGMRAWHAGASRCLGRERVNDFSVGIELEGCDDESFTLEQYVSLAGLLDALREEWPDLGPDRYFGHSDIAPGRKTDPGPCFDWRRIR